MTSMRMSHTDRGYFYYDGLQQSRYSPTNHEGGGEAALHTLHDAEWTHCTTKDASLVQARAPNKHSKPAQKLEHKKGGAIKLENLRRVCFPFIRIVTYSLFLFGIFTETVGLFVFSSL